MTDVTTNGTILTLTFKLKKDAADTRNISLTGIQGSNIADNKVYFSSEPVEIAVPAKPLEEQPALELVSTAADVKLPLEFYSVTGNPTGSNANNDYTKLTDGDTGTWADYNANSGQVELIFSLPEDSAISKIRHYGRDYPSRSQAISFSVDGTTWTEAAVFVDEAKWHELPVSGVYNYVKLYGGYMNCAEFEVYTGGSNTDSTFVAEIFTINNPGISGVGFNVDYGTELELVSCAAGDGYEVINPNLKLNPAYFNITAADNSDVTYDSKILTLTFRMKKDAEMTQNISLSNITASDNDDYAVNFNAPAAIGVTPVSRPELVLVSSKAKPKIGTSFQVDVVVKNNPGISGVAFNLHYGDQLELLSYSQNSAYEVVNPNLFLNPAYLNICSAGNQDAIENGTLVTLTFIVKNDAAANSQDIWITDISASDNNDENVIFSPDSKITVGINLVAETITKVTVNITDESSNDVISGYTINWYKSGEPDIIATGNELSLTNLAETTAYEYEVILSNDLGIKYYQPEKNTITIEPDLEFISENLILVALPTAVISGTVKDVSETGISGVNVYISQKLSGTFDNVITLTTEANGYFSVILPVGDTDIIFSKDGYKNATRKKVNESFENFVWNLSDIYLETLQNDNKITFGLIKKSAVKSGETAIETIINSSAAFDFTIRNNTKATNITDFTVQYPYIYLSAKDVSAGDSIEITAIDEVSGMTDVTQIVQLDHSLSANTDFEFNECGTFVTTVASENSRNVVMVFDSSGNFIDSVDFTGTTVTGNSLKKGTYTLAFLGYSTLLKKAATLSGLKALRAAMTEKSVNISDGVISEVSDVTIPKLDESLLYYTVANNTSFTVNKPDTSVGVLLTLRSEYAIDEKYTTSNQAVMIEVPQGVKFSENSVTLDGKAVPYNYNNNMITINTNKPVGVIRFCVTTIDSGQQTFSSSLAFKLGGEDIVQPIGYVTVKANALKINVPEKTALKNVPISGIALPEGNIKIYGNDELLSTTVANKAGNWSTQVTLNDTSTFSLHNIYAVCDGIVAGVQVSVKSEVKLLTFNITNSDAKKITIFYNAHNQKKLEMDLLNPTTKVPHFSYLPGTTFTYVVEFTNPSPDYVSDVKVVIKDHVGETTVLPAVWNDSYNGWVTSSKIVPYGVDVSFTSNDTVIIDEEWLNGADRIIDDPDNITDAEVMQLISATNDILGINDNYDPISYFDEHFSDMTEDEIWERLSAGIAEINRTQLEFESNNPLSEFGIAVETNGDIITISDKDGFYATIINGTCDAYDERLVESQGFIGLEVTDGHKIYLKNTENGSTVLDFTANSAQVIDIPAIAALSNSLMASNLSVSSIIKDIDTLRTILADIKSWISKINMWTKKCYDYFNSTELIKSYNESMKHLEAYRASVGSNPTEMQLSHLNELTREAYKCDEQVALFKNVKTGLDKAMKFVNIIFSTIELASNIDKIYTFYVKIMDCCDGSCNDPLKEEALSTLGYAAGAAVTKWLADLWMMPTLFAQISAGIPTLGTTILTSAVQLAAQYAAGNGLKATIKYNINWSDYWIEICRIKCSDCQCKLGTVCTCPPPCLCPDLPREPDSWWNYFWRELLPLPDPSGYVYEAVPSNRLESVTATAYYQQEVWGEDIDGNPTLIRTDTVLWDAENYSQENPLITDNDGRYAWDVPSGLWQVKYEKEGYQTIYSEWLPVPPPQTEVNIGMVSLTVPTAKVIAYPEGVEITFDKYMKTATVVSAITVKQDGISAAGTVEPKNEEDGLATVFRFTPSAELALTAVNVSIANTAESYAGVKILAFSQNTDVILEPKTLAAHNITIPYTSNGGDIIVEVTPGNAAAGKTITAVSSNSYIAAVDANTVVSSNGTAKIHITPLLPGAVNITLTLEGTNLQTQAEVNITMMEKTPKLNSPTASVPSGEVDFGTPVELSCDTEGTTIWYTTDGSDPLSSESRIEYTEPIVITEDTTLSAAAQKEGYDDSDVVTFEYTMKIVRKVVLVLDIKPEAKSIGYAIQENALIIPINITIQGTLDSLYKLEGSKDIIDLKVYSKDNELINDYSNLIGTGMRFVLSGGNPNEVTNIDFIVKSGDIDGDGKMDIHDAKLFLEHLVGNETLEGAYKLAVKEYEDASALRNLRKFLNDMPKN